MKPFRNAYEAIKRLLASIFKKGGSEQAEEFDKKPEQAETDNKVDNKVEKKVEKKVDTAEKTEAVPDKKPDNKSEAASGVAADKTGNKKAESKPGQKQGQKQGQKSGQQSGQKAKQGTAATGTGAKTDGGQNAGQQKAEPKKPKVKAPDADYVSKKDQADYDEEVKRRLERAAKREQKEKREEQRAARREMEAQNSAGGKKVIDPVTGEEVPLGTVPADATYLKKYSRIPTTSDAVITAINSILRHPEMSKNIVILGRNGFGTVRVGEDFARSFFSLGLVKSDKIAKIKARQLNKIGLEKLSNLKGGCLIIENAGLVQPQKLVEVINNADASQNDYVVILTGEIDSLAAFFEDNPSIVDQFIYLIDIHKIQERGMLALARGYVKEKGYTADKGVYEKLKASLAGMEAGNIDRFLEYLDGVIERCDTREKMDAIDKKEVLPQDVQ